MAATAFWFMMSNGHRPFITVTSMISMLGDNSRSAGARAGDGQREPDMKRIGISWGIAFAMLVAGSQVAHADFLNTTIPPNSDLSNDQVIQWDTSQSASPTLVTGTGVNDAARRWRKLHRRYRCDRGSSARGTAAAALQHGGARCDGPSPQSFVSLIHPFAGPAVRD
jgi:hypothetical protein